MVIMPGKERLSTLAFLLIFSPALFSACNGGELLSGEPTLQKENERLLVSEFHQEAFVPIEKAVYRYQELPGLFESLRKASDGYCEIIHRRKPFRKEVALELIAPDHFNAFWRDRFWGSFHNLLSGCWNFYIMNDIRPFDDFRLIQSLFPDEEKHCYSVGLMQPYIMHNILGCRDLNFLDVDWRIHYAHFQLEQMFRENRFSSSASAVKSIQDLHLGWIAFSPTPVSARHTVQPGTLCRLNQEECMEHLALYQKNRPSLSSINWNLSALHNASFSAHRGLPVVYLSNAIEEVYTSRKQFDQLLDRVSRSIPPGSRALFAYHAAGTDEIGLYLLTRKDSLPAAREGEKQTPDVQEGSEAPEARDGQEGQDAGKAGQVEEASFSISTICRDRYHRANTGVLKEYTTYFEKVSQSKKPPLCATLIKERL